MIFIDYTSKIISKPHLLLFFGQLNQNLTCGFLCLAAMNKTMMFLSTRTKISNFINLSDCNIKAWKRTCSINSYILYLLG